MCRIELSTDESLRLLDGTDIERLHAVIEANRDHLARWMPWAAGQTLDDTRTFVERTRIQIERNDGFQAAVISDEQIVGMVGLLARSSHQHRLLARRFGSR